MPTNRARLRRGRIEEVSATARWVASDFLLPEPAHVNKWEKWLLSFPTTKESRGACLEVWEAVREEILEMYSVMRPGRRPAFWWAFDAPRASDEMLRSWGHGEDCYLWRERPCEPRQRVGGIGRPAFEVSAYLPRFEYGLPADWTDIDPADPPRFESQAEYLRRHDLLLPGEARRLGTFDFESEAIEPEPEAVNAE